MTADIGSSRFEVDINYVSTYADGLLVSLEDNNTVRLVFFENVYPQNPVTGIDKTKRISRMKFEVRLSTETLARFNQHMNKVSMPEYLTFMQNLDHEKLKTSKMPEEIEEFERQIQQITFNTDQTLSGTKDVIMERFHEIMNLILKEREARGQ